MALDSRLIDLWVQIDKPSKFYYEITPSGKYFIFDQFHDYEISEDGMSIIFHFPLENAVFNRVGVSATSLIGEWTRYNSEAEQNETVIYLSDGTFIGHWDSTEYSHGFYEDTGSQIRTINFRGTVSTQGSLFYLEANGAVHGYRYEFSDGDNIVSFYDSATDELQWKFQQRAKQ